MAPQTFWMKQGDSLPVITATLVDQSGNVANLTGASVHFHMTNPFFGNVVNAAATIVNPTAGQVSYTWQTGDTNNTGTFACEWYVVFASGAQETYPQGYYNTVQIDPALTSGFTPAIQPTPLFNTVWNSTSVPTALQGNNGDFWINTATEMLYGPKASGAWGSGTTLVPSAGTSLSYFSPPTANLNMGGFGFSNLGSTTFNSLVAAPSGVGTTALVANNPSGTTSDVADFQVNGTSLWKITSTGALVGAPVATGAVPLTANTPSGSTAAVAVFEQNGTPVLSVNSFGNTAIGNSKQLDITGANSSPFLGNASSSFTPVWAAVGGTAPSLGNGTQLNKWFKVGRLVTCFYQYVYGSTTGFGTATDTWTWTLPFTAVTPLTGSLICVGSWVGQISGSVSNYSGAAYMSSSSTVSLIYAGNQYSVCESSPTTWVASSLSTLSIYFSYEATV